MHKTAVITGATKGLGRAIAEIFAAQGFDLCVCARTETDLQAMQAEWVTRFPGVQLHTFQADVGKKSETLEFAEFVRETCPRVDVLINNAGVYLPGLVHNAEDQLFEKTIETNLYSAFYTTKELVKLMLEKKQGHIFNISSIAGLQAYKNGGSYTVSKYALQGFTDALRDELKEFGIRVTSINPGAVLTDSWAGVDLPEDRFMDPEDIGKTVYDIYCLSKRTVVEKIILRPQLGDI